MKYEKLTMNISSILSCDKRLNLINTNIKISKFYVNGCTRQGEELISTCTCKL